MNLAQHLRGPDDEGTERFELSGGILAFGFRRLAIQDLSPAGHQPMRNLETGDWIVFNGEIYNYLELRAELEKLGDTFKSRCDTEVILKAYARWGDEVFQRLCGMFAIALYCKARKELLLARDPLGIKPLYVSWENGAFAFASETQALHKAGLSGNKIDRRAMAGMLAYGAVQEPLTMFEGVKAFPAGKWAAVDLSASNPRKFSREGRHWDYPELLEAPRDIKNALGRLPEILKTAVRSHLIADVPVGIFYRADWTARPLRHCARRHIRGWMLLVCACESSRNWTKALKRRSAPSSWG